MPQIIETTVYAFNELSAAAKERARCWYRRSALHDDWFDSVYDDFAAICALLGVDLKTRAVPPVRWRFAPGAMHLVQRF